MQQILSSPHTKEQFGFSFHAHVPRTWNGAWGKHELIDKWINCRISKNQTQVSPELYIVVFSRVMWRSYDTSSEREIKGLRVQCMLYNLARRCRLGQHMELVKAPSPQVTTSPPFHGSWAVDIHQGHVVWWCPRPASKHSQRFCRI